MLHSLHHWKREIFQRSKDNSMHSRLSRILQNMILQSHPTSVGNMLEMVPNSLLSDMVPTLTRSLLWRLLHRGASHSRLWLVRQDISIFWMLLTPGLSSRN